MFYIPVEIAFERKTILKFIQGKFVDEKKKKKDRKCLPLLKTKEMRH